jgi:hypothetical protein
MVSGYDLGTLPAYGFYIRHATGVVLDNVRIGFEQNDTRPAFVLDDVSDADFHHVRADKAPSAPTFDLTSVDDFTVSDGRPVGDIHMEHVTQKDL